MYPKPLKDLIDSFRILPGIGEKTAERLAFSCLNYDEENINFFVDSLKNVKTKITKCEICNTYTDKKICDICSNNQRNNKKICIVDDSKTLYQIEKSEKYSGKYYVLNGLISPLDGISAKEIGLEKLVDLISKNEVEEIILALKPTIEGETTSLYIKKILEKNEIKITKLASGIPLNADIEYIDNLTLQVAFDNRKEF